MEMIKDEDKQIFKEIFKKLELVQAEERLKEGSDGV